MRVINSSPEGVFEENAVRSFERWRWKSNKTGSQLVDTEVVQMFEFKLGSKCGHLDYQRALSEYDGTLIIRNILETEFREVDRRITSKTRKVNGLLDRFVNEKSSMTEAEKGVLRNEIDDLRTDIRLSKRDFRRDFQLRRREELEKLKITFYQGLRRLAIRRDLSQVLSYGKIIYIENQLLDKVQACSTTEDITDDLVVELNAQL